MTNNKQQTAVEWQHIELLRIIFKYATNKITPRDLQEQTKYILEQAKEMEMEQKANTWNNAINAVEKDKWESFEQYYEETFGGGEQ